MSFIQHDALNKLYQPGYFLAVAECQRETCQVEQNHSQVVTMANGAKYVPAGAYITNKGLLYEDVDVSTGAMPGSVVTVGTVYEDRLPAEYNSTVKNAIPGIKFISAAPAMVRPDFTITDLTALTVSSSASATTSGDTALTVSGYTLKTGEGWKYKVDTAAATVLPGEVVSGWTAWDGDDEITAATGKKLALVAVNAAGQAIAYGSCTVTAKA